MLYALGGWFFFLLTVASLLPNLWPECAPSALLPRRDRSKDNVSQAALAFYCPFMILPAVAPTYAVHLAWTPETPALIHCAEEFHLPQHRTRLK